MSNEPVHVFIAGRYNKYLRDLSQSPWIDKEDVRVKNSIQEIIEEGLLKYISYEKAIFSSSGREDVDVRMLGNGRPFVFKLVNPDPNVIINKQCLCKIESYVNTKFTNQVKIRYLQLVEKDTVNKNIKDGEESKSKKYRALCCCTRKLTEQDINRILSIKNLEIHQRTPVRVLHRRTLATRKRTIFNLSISKPTIGEFTEMKPHHVDKTFVLTLETEAGTYIKEFVHGDFGRTQPNLSSLLGDCETDLMELDVLEIYMDWPSENKNSATHLLESMDAVNPNDQNKNLTALTLPDLYDQAHKLLEKAESKHGAERQNLLQSARHSFEQATRFVNGLDIFSSNETIDEVATNNLRYLLLPAILASIYMKLDLGKMQSSTRFDTFSKAEAYAKNFLEKLRQYDLADSRVDQVLNDTSNDFTNNLNEIDMLTRMAQSRKDKIEQYNIEKELERALDETKKRIDSDSDADEEVVRSYYLNLIKKWINDTVQEYRTIKNALQLEAGSKNQSTIKKTDQDLGQPERKTFTLVKSDLQKQVFGLGYPSHPTVTVDEFITKKIEDGDLAFTAQKEVYSNSLQRWAENPDLLRNQEEAEQADKEHAEETENPEALAKARRWDEFKDDNPRGSGNRKNMG